MASKQANIYANYIQFQSIGSRLGLEKGYNFTENMPPLKRHLEHSLEPSMTSLLICIIPYHTTRKCNSNFTIMQDLWDGCQSESLFYFADLNKIKNSYMQDLCF